MAHANGLSVAATTGKTEERRAANRKAIPDSWILDPALLEGLQTPWETSKNDLMALDLPQKSGILSARELEITGSYSIHDLLKGLVDGQLTSEEVVTAFSKRAAIAHQVVCQISPCRDRNTCQLLSG